MIRCQIVILVSLLVAALPAFGQFSSDDFNAYNLKRSIWSYSDPLRDGTLTFSGTGTASAALSLEVPTGVDHQPWTNGYIVPRVMQACTNVDFQIETKFLSPLSQGFQIQGVLIEQDSTHFLRIDFSSDGQSTQLFAASFSGSYAAPVTRIPLDSIAPAGTGPLFLRISRQGNLWTVTYSLNGSSYLSPSPGSFSHTLTVKKVGLFAGNSGSGSSPAPGHTMLVDYFFNASITNPPDDGGTVVDVLPPFAYNVIPDPLVNAATIQWKTDEGAQGIVQYGTSLSYGKSVNHTDFQKTHSLTLTGLSSSTPYNYRIISTDNRGNKDTTGNFTFVTLAAMPPTISIWYGSPQSFGKLGVPQRDADILGTVSDSAAIDSLYYRLNGGPRVRLSLGPDTRRLQKTGDFDIDLTYAQLLPGANTVVVTAKNVYGATATATVTVNDNSSKVWPLPTSVSFVRPSSVVDSAQIIDGRWGLVPGGVRTIETGYDRSFGVGDTTWSDYQVTAQVVVNAIDSTWETIRGIYGGPGLGFLMRWKGHTGEPAFDPPITQPRSGYLPLGCVGWYRWRQGFDSGLKNRWEMLGNNLELKSEDSILSLPYGRMFNLKMQVRTIFGVGGSYKFKAWPDDQAEPFGWLLEGQETVIDPQQGSVLLLAHFVDVTVRKVSVIPGSQIPPSISAPAVTAGYRSAVIEWRTEPETKTTLRYGRTVAYTDTVKDPAFDTDHQAILTGLKDGLTYHYRIDVQDTKGLTWSTGDLTFATLPNPPASSLVTDEFNSATLNGSVWTTTIPVPPGAASAGATGTEAFLSLSSGVAHDLWVNTNTVPRIGQSCNNTDFDLEVKFTSSVTGDLNAYQIQGVLAEQDAGNLLRLDFDSGTADSIALFVAGFRGGLGSPTVLLNKNIAPHGTSPLLMKISRQGGIWKLGISFDGATWRDAGTLIFPLTVGKVSLFAANPGTAPAAFTALVDYFRVASVPVSVPAGMELPHEYALEQNYPNPFNPSTRIQFALPEEGHVTLEVFSAIGQKVATLLDELCPAGYRTVVFDARNFSSGLYISRLTVGGRAFMRKMMLLK